MPVKPIPVGYNTLSPYVFVKDCPKFIEFVEDAFNAEVKTVLYDANGKVANAEIKIGDSMLMISEATKQYPPTIVHLYLYFDNMDKYYNQSLSAGAVSVMEPVNQYYGDRNAEVKDPCGNFWWVATHVEDVSKEEMQKRSDEMLKKHVKNV